MQGIVLHADAKAAGGEYGEVEVTDDLELTAELGARDVRVRIEAAGVCGSDLSLAAGKYFIPTPLVMGHEGAGVVVEIGESVTACEVGDHVILSPLNVKGDLHSARGFPHSCLLYTSDAADE